MQVIAVGVVKAQAALLDLVAKRALRIIAGRGARRAFARAAEFGCAERVARAIVRRKAVDALFEGVATQLTGAGVGTRDAHLVDAGLRRTETVIRAAFILIAVETDVQFFIA